MPSDVSVRESVARRFWTLAVIEELRLRYKELGYDVSTQASVAGIEADLVARKDEMTEILEVKSGKWRPHDKEAVQQLRNWAAHNPNVTFKLILANPPHDPEIEVDGLEQALRSAWEDHVDTSAVANLASVARFEGLADLSIDEIAVRASGIEVAGSGVAEFEMQYGGLRDGFRTPDSYPFSYRIVLSHHLTLAGVLELEADTSSFYE